MLKENANINILSELHKSFHSKRINGNIKECQSAHLENKMGYYFEHRSKPLGWQKRLVVKQATIEAKLYIVRNDNISRTGRDVPVPA